MEPVYTADEARLAKQMTDAREEWGRASGETIVAMALLRDGHGDALLKLRMAHQNEVLAMKRYREAIEAYADATANRAFRLNRPSARVLLLG